MTSIQDEMLINQIIRMAWADDVSFDKIKKEKGVTETEVKDIMRKHLKFSSYKLWRKRVNGRLSKHAKRTKFLMQDLE
jgi:uncharacterized protein (TIGR03643 family)